MKMMMNSLDKEVNQAISTLSERSAAELLTISKIIERAYIHILIEQHLRVNNRVKVAGVSRLTPDPAA